MAGKLRAGILFGGKSAEHEISLRSAKNIAEAIDKSRYDITLIGIDKTGIWHLCPQDLFDLHTGPPDSIDISSAGDILLFCPGENNGMQIQTRRTPVKKWNWMLCSRSSMGRMGKTEQCRDCLNCLTFPLSGPG